MSACPSPEEPPEGFCEPTSLDPYYRGHDWRLLSRVPIEESEPEPDWPGGRLRRVVGYSETWYCTRCRRVEECKAP